MTLGVSCSTRILGMALLDSECLQDAKICLFKERWSNAKDTRILESIRRYAHQGGVSEVALLLPQVHRRSPQTALLTQRIKAWCTAEALPFHFYPATRLLALSERSRAPTQALMQALCLRYPELGFARRRELRNHRRYYSKLFEAAGVATLHAEHIRQHRT